MTADTDAGQPGARATITGVVYLLYFLTAVFAGVFVGRRLVVAFDIVNAIAYALYSAVTVLLYFLFRPVNRNLSLLAVILGLAGCADGVLVLFTLGPYKISSLTVFAPYCLLIGYLFFRSTFVPRFLGVLMASAGVGWLIFLSPLAPPTLHLPDDPRLSRRSLPDAVAHRERSEYSAIK